MSVLRKSAIYSMGNALTKGTQFLLLPVYTHYLRPDDYGALDLINVACFFILLLTSVNIDLAYSRYYFQDHDRGVRNTFFSTAQLWVLTASLILLTTIYVWSSFIAAHLFAFPQGATYLEIAALGTAFQALMLVPMQSLRVQHKAAAYVGVSIVNLVLLVAVTLHALIVLNHGVEGVLWARVWANMITCALLMYMTRSCVSRRVSLHAWRLLVKYSIHLVPANMSYWVLNAYGRYYLQHQRDMDEVGLYALGAKLASVVTLLFAEPIKLAFGPYLFAKIEDAEECKRTLAIFTRLFFAGVSVVVLVLSLYGREIVELLAARDYAGSHTVIFVLGVSYLVFSVSNAMSYGLQIRKKTWVLSVTWPVTAVLGLVVHYWMISAYGRMGAAMAMLICAVMFCVGNGLAVRIYYPYDVEPRRKIVVVLLLCLCYFAGVMIEPSGLIVRIGYKALVIAVYLTGLWVAGNFSIKTNAELV